MNVKIKQLHPNAKTPKYATTGAACFDLVGISKVNDSDVLPEFYTVFPKQTIIMRTGLQFEIPDGYVMKVYSRSGMGFKQDTRLANCVGIIDSDYRGEVMVKLTNDGNENLYIAPNDRIAQAMIEKYERVEFEVVEELSDTVRGSGGFGSSGK